MSKDLVEICYSPVIQSGGTYDIRVSASSNDDILSSDVIICSIGSRYKNYCANISRTFLVDATPKIEQTYNLLIGLYNACLEAMVIGNEFKDVYEAAKTFLTKKNPELLGHLPKSLGFVTGIEFRDPSLVLNATNSTKFTEDMILNLAVGLHNVPHSSEDKKEASSAAVKKLSVFSMLIADTVKVQKEGVPEVLTKHPKEFGDVSYNISEKEVSVHQMKLRRYHKIVHGIRVMDARKSMERTRKRRQP